MNRVEIVLQTDGRRLFLELLEALAMNLGLWLMEVGQRVEALETLVDGPADQLLGFL